jgi:hypothetical protein
MKFTLASNVHEPQLLRLAREQAMPGWIRLSFAHEPEWNQSVNVLGHSVQTIVGTNADGTVAGCGVRAIRCVYINGKAGNIGYLSGLRSFPGARRQGALARGFSFLRKLHEADQLTPAYLTTIVEANIEVATLLTSCRTTLPAYLDQGRFITSAMPLGQGQATPPPQGLTLHTGADIPLADILAFLCHEGAKRQFFPILCREDFASPRFLGFNPENFLVALDGDKIAGVTAVWDQHAFRQTLIAGYSPPLNWARPLLNAGLRLTGNRTLPPPGKCLRFLHTAFTCIRDSDPVVFSSLLGKLCVSYNHSPHHFFVVGLHEQDPLRSALRKFMAFHYSSRLYLACWDDGRLFCESLDSNLVPHLETALL